MGQDFRKKLFPAVSTSYIKLAHASAIVSGPASEPMLADTEFGAVAGLGVKLRAGAFYVLFGFPACELTNRVIKLDDILGNAAAEIIEQMAGEVTPSAKAQCFERTLVRFAQRVSEGDFLIERQAVTLLRRRPTMPISRLAEKLGYSSRQLQRKFHDFVGLNPRKYRQICRFERALESIQVSLGNIDWPAIALACGFSDQAHLIRDFREFAGQTPALYLKSLRPK